MGPRVTPYVHVYVLRYFPAKYQTRPMKRKAGLLSCLACRLFFLRVSLDSRSRFRAFPFFLRSQLSTESLCFVFKKSRDTAFVEKHRSLFTFSCAPLRENAVSLRKNYVIRFGKERRGGGEELICTLNKTRDKEWYYSAYTRL